MIPRNLLAAVLSALLVAAPASAAPAKRAPAASPVVESAAGWTFGRAGAPLLTEYASIGCPHCGDDAKILAAPIERRVKAGKIRFSYRPFLIFPHDRAGMVLARCVAPVKRLGFIKSMLLGQAATRGRLAAADADETLRGQLFAAELAGPEVHAALLARLGGLSDLARAHGLSASAEQACLASSSHHRWVTEADMTSRLSGVTGTPTYYWKGVRLPSTKPEALLALLPN